MLNVEVPTEETGGYVGRYVYRSTRLSILSDCLYSNWSLFLLKLVSFEELLASNLADLNGTEMPLIYWKQFMVDKLELIPIFIEIN